MNGLWQWVPGISVGPFTFGDPVARYHGLQKCEPDGSSVDWDTYACPDVESRIVVQDGRIINVHCLDEVEYRSRNLIGMQSSDVRKLLGTESEKEENALYYNDLGLTLFM